MATPNRYYSSNAIDTSLVFGISNSDTQIVLATTAGYPTSYPFTLAIGFDTSSEELVDVTGVGSVTNSYTITRGVDSTSAVSHSAGGVIKHVVTARDLREAQAHIAATTSIHGIADTSVLTTTTNTQTLTNKTITGGTVNATALQQGGVAAVLTTDTRLNPVGVTLPYAGSSAPTGYLLCDGASVSRTTYSALFGILGTTYGSVDGSTFNIPNLKGKIPVGRDSAQAEFDTLGETGGEKTHVLTTSEIPSHSHTTPALSGSFTSGGQSVPHTHTTDIAHGHGNTFAATQNSHAHSVPGVPTGYTSQRVLNSAGAGGASVTSSGSVNTDSLAPLIAITGGVTALGSTPTGSGNGSVDHNHTTTVSFAAGTSGTAGTDGAHNNLQPYIVLNYIIKY
jgi:microcystin-dependent protein